MVNMFISMSLFVNSFIFYFLGQLLNTILIGVYEPLKNSQVCQVATVDKNYRHAGNGLVFKKKWAYTNVFNFHMLKVNSLVSFLHCMCDTHIVLQLKGEAHIIKAKMLWENRSEDLTKCVIEPIEAAGLETVQSVFALWTMGIVVAVVAIMVEMTILKGRATDTLESAAIGLSPLYMRKKSRSKSLS
jgi:hypothetical protein